LNSLRIVASLSSLEAVIEYTDHRTDAPARLVASSQKIYEELSWKAEYSLEQIIKSAWKWHSRNVK
jgi:UDP-glucose 4-epimerase